MITEFTVDPSAPEETAIILCNGPSLKGVDLQSLPAVATFGMNVAYRHWDRIGWYPTHYSCLDTVVGLHHADAIGEMIGRAGLPAALFGLGGVLVRYRPEGDLRIVAMISALSLLLHPAITFLLGTHAFALSISDLRSATVTGAMAPGINAYLFAHMYGVGKRVAATAVLIGTALSIVTTWFWLHILP